MAEKKYRVVTKKNVICLVLMLLFSCFFIFLFIRQIMPGQKKLVYVATVKDVRNNCSEKIVKSEIWNLISKNDFIENRSTIRTSENSFVELALTSGARVTLGEISGCIAYYDKEYGFAIQLEDNTKVIINLLNCENSLIVTGSDFNKLMEVKPGSLIEFKYGESIDATAIKGEAMIYGKALNEIKLSEKSSFEINSSGLVLRKAITVLSPVFEKDFSKMGAELYPVEFSWIKNNDSVKKLRLEVYKDSYFVHPVLQEDVDASVLKYTVKLDEGSYFWRILLPSEDKEKKMQVLVSDRFYISR